MFSIALYLISSPFAVLFVLLTLDVLFAAIFTGFCWIIKYGLIYAPRQQKLSGDSTINYLLTKIKTYDLMRIFLEAMLFFPTLTAICYKLLLAIVTTHKK